MGNTVGTNGGCSYGRGTRWAFGIFVALAVTAAGFLFANVAAVSGDATAEATMSALERSELREGLGRIETRQEQSAKVLDRIEEKLFDGE